MVHINKQANRIKISGSLGLLDFRRVLARIFDSNEKNKYSDFYLDFSECTSAQPGPMLAICAQAMKFRRTGLRLKVILPKQDKLARLFRNTNWAYLLDPENFGPSEYHGYATVPATNFISAADQQNFVSMAPEAILRSMEGFTRKDLDAIEWAIAEITDNVLIHSNSPVGGIAQITNLKRKRQVEYVVCDAGDGIPKSLRGTHPAITSDSDALDQAIREGVTRDKKLGQGNGLFGSYQVSRVSGGFFHIHAGSARLDYDHSFNLPRLHSEAIPYQGTLVVASIDISKPESLAKALRFQDGGIHTPMDTIEYRYESKDSSDIILKMREQTSSFSSRLTGASVRLKINNLISLSEKKKVIIDFSDLPLISSSFADEVFGKLFLDLGPLRFMRAIEIRNASETVLKIIDKAIAQRSTGDA